MKYFGMPMGMWALFGKSFERNLCATFGLGENTAKAVKKKAKKQNCRCTDFIFTVSADNKVFIATKIF